jgi:hypothetical protein
MKEYVEAFRSTKPTVQQQPAWVSLLMGGASKVIASTLTYPFQLIKTRMQQRDNPNTMTPRYRGMTDCIVHTYRFFVYYSVTIKSILI